VLVDDNVKGADDDDDDDEETEEDVKGTRMLSNTEAGFDEISSSIKELWF